MVERPDIGVLLQQTLETDIGVAGDILALQERKGVRTLVSGTGVGLVIFDGRYCALARAIISSEGSEAIGFTRDDVGFLVTGFDFLDVSLWRSEEEVPKWSSFRGFERTAVVIVIEAVRPGGELR